MFRYGYDSASLTQGAAALLSAFAVLLLLSAVPPPAYAQTVTLPITCTMDNSAAMVTLGLTASDSSTPSPPTVSCDGASHGITVNPSITLTATEPFPDGPSTRGRFSGGSMTTATTTCSSGTCPAWTFTNFLEILNNFAVNAQAQTDFDTGMTWAFACTQAGAAGSCVISSTAAPSDSAFFWTDYGRSFAFPATPSGAPSNSRWMLPSPLSNTLTTYANTYSAGYYKQWSNLFAYSVTGGGTPTPPHLYCNYLGTPDSDMDAIAVFPAPYWCDNSSTATTTNPSTNSGSTERWSDNAQSFTITGGGASDTFSYYHQYLNTFSFSVKDGGTPSAPTLTSTQFGSVYAKALTTTATGYWLDSTAACSVTNPAGGSTSTERWDTNAGCPSVGAGQIIAFSYYHQYAETLNYSVVGGGTPNAPTFSGVQFGKAYSSSPTKAATAYWFDATSSVSISGSSGAVGERWASPVSSYVVSKGASFTILLYHQYLVQSSFSVLGGGSGYTLPLLSFSNFSRPASVPMSIAGVPEWADSGSRWSTTNPLLGSTPNERWQSNQTSSAALSAPLTIDLTYYHQYLASFHYSVTGGGPGYSPPTISFAEFGSNVIGAGGWVDAGSMYAYTDPLPGSSSQERWYAGSNSGVINGPENLSATYYHQYAFDLSYSGVPPGAGYKSPVVNITYLGGLTSRTIQQTQSIIWLDSATGWSVNSVLGGSNSTGRWATDQVTSGQATASLAAQFVFYRQYRITVGYAIVGGGSPQPPSLTYTSFGQGVEAQISNASRSVWVDSGSTWGLPTLLSGSNQMERWITNALISAPVVSALTTDVSYLHQYFLHVVSDSPLAGTFLNSTRWYNEGEEISLNATAAPRWEFVYWKGVGSGAYNGTNPAPRFALAGPATELAVFYPSLTISTDKGGSVTYEVGTSTGTVSGGPEVIYLPLGANVSLKATPAIFDYIFTGWSGAPNAKGQQATVLMSAPQSVGARFELDSNDIAVVAIAIPVVVVMAVYILIVRRWQGRQ